MLILILGLLVQQAPALPRVLLETELGEIEIEVDNVRAPITGENFLKYVALGLYDEGTFHRTVRKDPDNQPQNAVKIDVIQAAANAARRGEFPPSIVLERTKLTGLLHKDATISMARSGPDTGRSEFFICIGDQPELDFGGTRNADGQGFAAFGRVTRGMDVVRKIHARPADGQTLLERVKIVRARVLR